MAHLIANRSAWIVEHCLSGNLVKGRTVLLVVNPLASIDINSTDLDPVDT